MSFRHASAALLALACCGLTACTETVGFLSLRLEAPELDPPVQCQDDPRRVETLRFELRCGGETFSYTYAADDPSMALSDLPLGSCAVTVEAENTHGRLVFSGAQPVTIESGDNPQIALQLVLEPCRESCDGDGDGVPDADELALGLDPSSADSDRDGIDDGFELYRCCSDPKLNDNRSCALGVQQVLPRIGPPDENVVIKTSQLIADAKVTLGGAPLDQLFTDPSTILLGKIDREAVLGELRVEVSGQPAALWGELYPVLRRDPELIVELDQRAGAAAALIATVVDMVAVDDALFILGTSASSGSTGVLSLPVVLRYDLVKDEVQRFPIPRPGTKPVAIAARDGRLAVLGLVSKSAGGGNALLAHLDISDVPVLPLPKITELSLDLPGASGLLVEPGGRYAQVIGDKTLLRLDLQQSGPRRLVQLPPVAPDPNNAARGRSCSGLALRRGNDVSYTYAACTERCVQAAPAPAPCGDRALLMRFGPNEKCFGGAVGANGQSPPGCWSVAPVPAVNDRALGSPVVAEAAQRVYLLTSESGLFAAPVEPPLGPPLLERIAAFKAGAPSLAPHPMVLDAKRQQLYVILGSRVLRLESGQTPRPFPVGNVDQERATMLALTKDGSSLAVVRSIGGGAPTLLGVCVARCPTCPCR